MFYFDVLQIMLMYVCMHIYTYKQRYTCIDTSFIIKSEVLTLKNTIIISIFICYPYTTFTFAVRGCLTTGVSLFLCLVQLTVTEFMLLNLFLRNSRSLNSTLQYLTKTRSPACLVWTYTCFSVWAHSCITSWAGTKFLKVRELRGR